VNRPLRWNSEAKVTKQIMKLKKTLKWVLVVGICLLLFAQFVGPAKTNPLTDQSKTLAANAQVDPKVGQILDRSCGDCHSNNTRWPWYSNVAPVSWFVINHVDEGRHDLNFSEWGNYDKRRQNVRLSQMCDLVKAGEMPLSSYTPLHPGTKPSADEVKAICDWTTVERARTTEH
jgi:Haem-binding domain